MGHTLFSDPLSNNKVQNLPRSLHARKSFLKKGGKFLFFSSWQLNVYSSGLKVPFHDKFPLKLISKKQISVREK